jgi:hypothetical protein
MISKTVAYLIEYLNNEKTITISKVNTSKYNRTSINCRLYRTDGLIRQIEL